MSKKNTKKPEQTATSSWWRYATLAYAAFILVAFPLFTDSTGFYRITRCKFVTFAWSSVIYFAAVTLPFLYVWVIRNQRNLSLRKNILPKKYSYTQLLLALYTLWAIISAIASPYGKETFMGQGRYDGLVSYLLYTFVFLFVSFWIENNEYFLRGVTLSGLVFAVISILQLFVHGIIHDQQHWFWNQPYMGTIGNVDMVAGFAALYIPTIIAAYVYEKDKRWNPVYLASIVLFTFAQTVGDADSGKVGIFFGLLLVLPFLLNQKDRRKKTLFAFAALIFGVFLAKFLSIQDGTFHFGRDLKALFFDNKLLKEASGALKGELDDNAGSGRGYLWKTSFWLATQKPILGTGPGTFFKTYYPYDRFTTQTDFAHNDFLQNAVTIGFVGMGLYVLFLLSLAYRALKNAKDNPFIIAFGAGAAAYLAHSFFSFSIAIVTPMFWVMAGMLEREIQKVEAQKKEEKEKSGLEEA